MEMQRPVNQIGRDDIPVRRVESNRTDIEAQLEKMIASRHFRNSKRYPSLLRFIVDQTLEGKSDLLKERNLGTYVFGKPSDYDTNADPIVRVTAGEIRKRIAQYYQDPGHEDEWRIELPLGSYVPHFSRPTHDAPAIRLSEDHGRASEVENATTATGADNSANMVRPTRARARRKTVLLWGLAATVLLLSGIAGNRFLVYRSNEVGLRSFWTPILSSNQHVLIVMGVHSLQNGEADITTDVPSSSGDLSKQNMLASMTEWDMVPISDIISYSKITDLLTRQSHPYRLKGSAETTLEELREGPVILIGGLDNVWTMRLTSGLRFNFFRNGQISSTILDRQDPSKTFTFSNTQLAHADSRDYAIVASYFAPTIGQRVVVAAGIGKSGTQAAAEFLTSNDDLKPWLIGDGSKRPKNVELVLSTDILNGEPAPPSVVASTYW